MKTKHKHRRSNSTQISVESQPIDIEVHEKVNTSFDLSHLPSFSTEILSCLSKSEEKIQSKLTIVEDLNVRLEAKRYKGLEEIEEDLKSWDQFQESFLNVRISKNTKPLCLREKKDKFRNLKHLISENSIEMPQPRGSLLKLFKKKSIRNK